MPFTVGRDGVWERDDTTPVFVISVAAELTGLHAQTLRQYDRLGLVSPGRTPGGGRRYSRRDIAVLREVRPAVRPGRRPRGRPPGARAGAPGRPRCRPGSRELEAELDSFAGQRDRRTALVVWRPQPAAADAVA